MSWNEEAGIARQFRFKCPQVWDRLQPTAVEGVRHCLECRRDVHLALTEEAFRLHSDEGRCIAVPVLLNNPEGDPNEPIYWMGQVDSPYGGPAQAGVNTILAVAGRLRDRRKGGTDESRTMSRRTLCKTILSMGLLTAIDPLNTLRTSGASETHENADQPGEPPREEEEVVTHICGRHLPNGGFTIRSKRTAG